ncbi:MAG: RNA polymerase sigma-70 factor [Ferruginibacter sp.]
MPDPDVNMERGLLLQVADGNENAFAQIFHLHRDKLYSFILDISASKVLAEDVVQDVFLKIWHKRMDLAEVQNFNSYLFRIAHNHAVNLIKRKVKEKLVLADVRFTEKISVDIDDELDFREVEKFFHEAVENLPKRQKMVFILSRDHGLKQEEIARQLNISVTTVKCHMKLALRSIRQQCKESYPAMSAYYTLAVTIFLIS